MSKPIYLREETWLFLLQKLANLQGKTESVLTSLGYVMPPQESLNDDDLLPLLAEQPGPFLLHAGILKYPSLLCGTVIELENGQECIITRRAARELQQETEIIIAQDAGTRKITAVSRNQIIYSLQNGLLFDQVSRKMMLAMQ